MRRWLGLLALILAGIASTGARAACSVPFTFVNNTQVADANQVNANFNAVVSCINSIFSGPVTIGGNLTVTGTISSSGAATIGGALTVSGSTFASPIIGGTTASSTLTLESSNAVANSSNTDRTSFLTTNGLTPPVYTYAPTSILPEHWEINNSGTLFGFVGTPSTSQNDSTYNCLKPSNVIFQNTNISQGVVICATLPNSLSSAYNVLNVNTYDNTTSIPGGNSSVTFQYALANNGGAGSAVAINGGAGNNTVTSAPVGAVQEGVETQALNVATFGTLFIGGGDNVAGHYNGYAMIISSAANAFSVGIGFGQSGSGTALSPTGTAFLFANTTAFGAIIDASAMSSANLAYVLKGPTNASSVITSTITAAGVATFAGNVTANKNAAAVPGSASGIITAQAADTVSAIIAQSSAAASSIHNLVRADGTIASPSQVLSADEIGRIQSVAYSSAGSYRQAQSVIEFIATENQGTGGFYGQKVVVMATPTGSATAETEATFQNGVGIGALLGQAQGDLNALTYHVNGSAGVSCTVNTPAHLTVVNGLVTLCN